MKLSLLHYVNELPAPSSLAAHPIAIYDKNLRKHAKVKKWLRTFSHAYGIDAGENLKQLRSFEEHLNHLLKITASLKVKNITFVAIGGGSVGDFVGFLASVFKRGTPLIHFPSTWLAAIDSAHGGKTALNVGDFKNQIGTFYPAQKVFLCRSLLLTQPPARTQEAMGEVLKTALLAGGKLWKKISQEREFSSQKLWNYLPLLIGYKYKIVKRDPYEKKGLRYFLNLGHTFGHALELSYHLPHGQAVNLGLLLALEFSVKQKIMTPQTLEKLSTAPLLQRHLAPRHKLLTYLKKIKASRMSTLLVQDKKLSTQGNINFIYLVKPGQPRVQETSLKELLQFYQNLRQQGF